MHTHTNTKTHDMRHTAYDLTHNTRNSRANTEL